jgi:hypothetical protein
MIKGMKRRREQWESDIANRQRNVQWHDTFRNNHFVNELLWKGRPDATLVQRIGIALFSIAPLTFAVVLISVAWDASPDPAAILFLLMALPFIVFGTRLLRNAFMPSASKSDSEIPK